VKIFLIRHGESTVNTGDNFISRIPDHLVSLTENGIIQANIAGKRLSVEIISPSASFVIAALPHW